MEHAARSHVEETRRPYRAGRRNDDAALVLGQDAHAETRHEVQEESLKLSVVQVELAVASRRWLAGRPPRSAADLAPRKGWTSHGR